jgi:uncharacterized protein (DUF4415 family)
MEILERGTAVAKSKGRPKRSERDDVTVKVDRAVIDRLRMVALHKKTTLNELLTELLRVPADKLHSQMVRELEGKG